MVKVTDVSQQASGRRRADGISLWLIFTPLNSEFNNICITFD